MMVVASVFLKRRLAVAERRSRFGGLRGHPQGGGSGGNPQWGVRGAEPPCMGVQEKNQDYTPKGSVFIYNRRVARML